MNAPVHRTAAILAGVSIAITGNALAEEQDVLLKPRSVVIDASIPSAQREAMSLAARRYYTFWNTGESPYAQAALAAGFVDRNLPQGRPQGPEGPIFASRFFRTAVPDLRVEVEEMLMVGDRVVGRLHFAGHFTGTFGSGPQAKQGDGRPIDFIAVDIYRIEEGRIAENWHLEDNLTLLQQLGVVPR
jgi:predicted ester cyclase